MTTLEEIKAAIVERIDTAWNELKDQVDADKVRTYVQGLTGELLSHVYAVEAELVNHVLGKQAPAAPAQDPGTVPAPEQPTTTASPAAAPDPAPASSLVDGGVPANPTGMAADPQPPADEPAPAAAEPEPGQ